MVELTVVVVAGGDVMAIICPAVVGKYVGFQYSESAGVGTVGDVEGLAVGGSVGDVVDGGFVGDLVDGASVGDVVDGACVGTLVDGGSVGSRVDGASVGDVVDGISVGAVVDGGSVGAIVDGGSVGGLVDTVGAFVGNGVGHRESNGYLIKPELNVSRMVLATASLTMAPSDSYMGSSVVG